MSMARDRQVPLWQQGWQTSGLAEGGGHKRILKQCLRGPPGVGTASPPG